MFERLFDYCVLTDLVAVDQTYVDGTERDGQVRTRYGISSEIRSGSRDKRIVGAEFRAFRICINFYIADINLICAAVVPRRPRCVTADIKSGTVIVKVSVYTVFYPDQISAADNVENAVFYRLLAAAVLHADGRDVYLKRSGLDPDCRVLVTHNECYVIIAGNRYDGISAARSNFGYFGYALAADYQRYIAVLLEVKGGKRIQQVFRRSVSVLRRQGIGCVYGARSRVESGVEIAYRRKHCR